MHCTNVHTTQVATATQVCVRQRRPIRHRCACDKGGLCDTGVHTTKAAYATQVCVRHRQYVVNYQNPISLAT